MASSDPPPGRTVWPRFIRPRWAVPLSLALHAALLTSFGVVPWPTSDIPQIEPPPPSRVVWLESSPRLPADERALEPVEPSSPPEPPPPAEQLPDEHVADAPAPSPPAERATPRTVEPRPRATRSPEAASGEGSTPVRPPVPPVPDVDWDKERKDAIRDVLNQRASEREYLTFSLDDLVKEEPEPEPVLPPLMVDNCVIVKGKLQRFAALMMGRCVREARGDLFAAIKPAYLKAHPVCVETRPDSPGSFLSDGRQISTVKCELVVDEDK